jgi:hypothetical protein
MTPDDTPTSDTPTARAASDHAPTGDAAPARRHAPTDDRGRRRSTLRHTGRGALLLSALVLAAVAASAAASATLGQDPPTQVERQLDAEIEGMVDSGVPADDPKVEMLEDEVAAIEDGDGEAARREAGVDIGEVLEGEESPDPSGSSAADAEVAGSDDGWQSGTVVCEPIPGLLSADEIAGARCVSVPQPDGSSRYVAVSPDGTVRTVLFGDDGVVHREADTALAAPPADAALAPTPEGDLQVAPPGEAPATVDLP